MDSWLEFIKQHASHAHWFIFGGALLAGLNIPISIDLLMIISAVLAAAIIPANTIHLFLAMFLGCLFSAWIAFGLGRVVGPKLMKWPIFSKFISEERVVRMKAFYERRGFAAFLIGRFIPFGVRNCLFMSSGMSRISFRRFATYDAVACFLWTLASFSLYYTLGKNIDVVYSRVKIANLLIFLAFAVTVIGIIWYKKNKRA